MNNLSYAIIIVAMLVLGFVGIIAGYAMRIMSYPYSRVVLWVSVVMFLVAVLLPLFLSNRKEDNDGLDENILDRDL